MPLKNRPLPPLPCQLLPLCRHQQPQTALSLQKGGAAMQMKSYSAGSLVFSQGYFIIFSSSGQKNTYKAKSSEMIRCKVMAEQFI